MAKEVSKVMKLQVRGGQANPSPPVGPALGAAGVNIMEFCKQFNARSQEKMGQILPVVITVYADKSFDFIVKTPPAAVQLMEAAKIKKGSSEPNRNKVAKVTWDAIRKIAEDEEFGRCEECGKRIPDERLLIVPEATRCVPCQREMEKWDSRVALLEMAHSSSGS